MGCRLRTGRGIVARLVVPGRQHLSMGMTLLLGLIGSVVAGVVANALALAAEKGSTRQEDESSATAVAGSRWSARSEAATEPVKARTIKPSDTHIGG